MNLLCGAGFCLVLITLGVNGQFPTVCITPDALASKTCCPDQCGGPSRGRCEDVSEYFCYPDASLGYDQLQQIADARVLQTVKLLNDSSTETRYLWPTKVFNRTCTCVDNFAGFDCSECKWGYVKSTQGECIRLTSATHVRRNYLSLSRADQLRHISAFAKSKTTTSRYSVMTHEPDRAKGEAFTVDDFVTNSSVYDVIVWIHYFTAKDGITVDFAHGQPAFLTWHRWYLLFVDREMQWVTGDSSFTLAYWDWTDKATRNKMFDGTTYAGTGCKLCGEFANFDIKCSRIQRLLYNFQPAPLCSTKDFWQSPDLVTRNVSGVDYPFINDNSVGLTVRNFSTKRDIYYALELGIKYDDVPYNATATNNESFRNLIEGLVKLPNKTYCPGPFSINELHNGVHTFIGSTMTVVTASANDPIFWLHHSNVDRILEMWIQSKDANSTWFRPQNGGAPGHNAKDCLVPVFPLVKNEDMLVKSTDLGYTYDDLQPPTQPVEPDDLDELNMCRTSGGNPATSPLYACDCPPSASTEPTTTPNSGRPLAVFSASLPLIVLVCAAVGIVSESY